MKNDALLGLVNRALNWQDGTLEWLPRTKSGRISAVQLLAIILWALSGEEPKAETDQRIVDAWSERLADATAARAGWYVTPRDPVTCLEIHPLPPSWDWMMAIDDADYFLELMGAGYSCSKVLAYWRGEESPYTAPSDAILMTEPHSPIEGSQTALNDDERLGWTLRKPQRFQGYAPPLYAYLKTAKDTGSSLPTVHDVLNAWLANKPAEVAKVLADGIDYYNANGTSTKHANHDAMRKAIRRMTTS